MTMQHDEDNKIDGIVLVSEKAAKILNPKQEIAYREHRRELAKWMLNLGGTQRRSTDTATLRRRRG